jgi:putative DNA primase/helicase
METRRIEPPPPYTQKYFNMTQLGNAERMVSRHSNQIRYCHEWKKWLAWDGVRWSRSENGQIHQLAKETIRSISKDARTVKNPLQADSMKAYARRCETQSHIKGVIEAAQSQPGIPVMPEDLDRDPMLLNCLNGTINLRTGNLCPHDRDDLLTKLAPVRFQADSKAEVWLEFLSRILAEDQAMIDFLQQAIGYCLTGLVTEKCLFLLIGSGNNGKTTFVETIRKMLGEYAGVMDIEALMAKAQTAEKERAIADLLGKRFVVSSEAAEGQPLHEARMKNLTGMGRLVGRRIYGSAFEFDPQFKIFMDANHKPVIRGTEDAVWSRFRVIPFNVPIPAAEQDKQLGEKLERELPGILTWAVEGCLKWQKQGRLIVPSTVTEANAGYRQEMDLVEDFISDCCLPKPGAKETSANLYNAFKSWCADNYEQPINPTSFGNSLTKKGYPQVRTSVARGRKGLELRRDATVTLSDTVYLPTV